jgi:hypothetical protein
MGEARVKKANAISRTQRLIAENPFCYLCGGTTPAVSEDHVPPRACFPDGWEPDDMQFAACSDCNGGTSKTDQIFGVYSMMTDFNSETRSEEQLEKFRRMLRAISARYPGSIPDFLNAKPVNKIGNLYSPDPVAYEVKNSAAFQTAAVAVGIKLLHALYYRRVGRALTHERWFTVIGYQLQDPATVIWTDYFKETLPEQEIATKVNHKDYGLRFAYKQIFIEQEDFFVFAAQFGLGLVIWGMVLESGRTRPGAGEPMGDLPWMRGGCGNPSKLDLAGYRS